MGELIETLRRGLVCDRCGRYVGSLARGHYMPAAYPVAVEDEDGDEAQALVAFEWHMLGLLHQGRFTIRHPERDGVCISAREWAELRSEDEGNER
jgi:hypothetical protein